MTMPRTTTTRVYRVDPVDPPPGEPAGHRYQIEQVTRTSVYASDGRELHTHADATRERSILDTLTRAELVRLITSAVDALGYSLEVANDPNHPDHER